MDSTSCSTDDAAASRSASVTQPKTKSESFSPLAKRIRNLKQDELARKTVHLTFHSMDCLMDILVTVSRIGAKIEYVSAKADSAILSVFATPFVCRRIPSLLRELISVTELNEL